MTFATQDQSGLLSLEESDEFVPISNRGKYARRGFAVVGILALVVGAAVVLQRGSGMSQMENRGVVGLDYSALATCYGFTGGTCKLSGCSASRNAQCVKRQCVCVGTCAGPDGKCYPFQDTPVKLGFALTNKKWPKYSLYRQAVSAHGQLKTAKWTSFASKYYFNLYQMPSSHNHPLFLMNANSKPGDALYVAKTGLTLAVSKYAFYSVSMSKSYGPDVLALSVCRKATVRNDEIMIGNADWSRTVYIHSGSKLVYAYGNSLGPCGDGCIWKLDKNLTIDEQTMIPLCTN